MIIVLLTTSQKRKYASVAEKMRKLGAIVTFPLQDPPQPEVLQYEGDTAPVHKISCW